MDMYNKKLQGAIPEGICFSQKSHDFMSCDDPMQFKTIVDTRVVMPLALVGQHSRDSNTGANSRAADVAASRKARAAAADTA
jgi:hypothetical protein